MLRTSMCWMEDGDTNVWSRNISRAQDGLGDPVRLVLLIWQTIYASVRLVLHVEDWVTQETLNESLIPGGRSRVDVYWRALR